MIKNYFKIAFRGFWRHKLFTLINIIGLTIGISAALVIYLIVHFDLTFDKFHKDGDRIYRVVTNFSFQGNLAYNPGVTGMLPDIAKNSVTGLQESVPFYDQGGYNLVIPGKTPVKFKNQGNIIYADQRYFNVFNYKWLAGSPKTSLSAPFTLVLTATQAQKYFPSFSAAQVIGKQVVYADSIKTTVTGVIDDFKENTDFTFQQFISFSSIKHVNDINQQLTDWGSTNSSSQFFVKLMPGAKAKSVESQLNALLKKNKPARPEDRGNIQELHLQPLNDIHFNNNYGALDNNTADKNTLYGLMVIAVFLLLLGCINFINLNTAQASQRAKEIGIRKTLGSSRRQLIIQYLSETFIISLFAVIIAVALVPVILKLFVDFIPAGVEIDIAHQPDLIVFLSILTVTVSFLSGFYPAFVLSGYQPVLVLKNQAYAGTSKTRNAWLRKSLTVTQFAIAQFFIMATILVSKQIYFALHTDLGFKKDAIVYVNTPWQDRNPNHQLVLFNKIKAIPQVAMASVGGDAPSSDGFRTADITYRNSKKEIKTELLLKSGDENYIKVYRIKLLAGRNITLDDNRTGLLINKTYANILGFKDMQRALGEQIEFRGKKKMTIVGVIADFQQASLHAPVKPLGILPEADGGTFHILLKPQATGSDEWKNALAAMQSSWKQIYPDDDFDYHFFDESIKKMYEDEQHTSTLLTWATGLSIFISCLGLLGFVMYTTNQRAKEIGVRKVLGASVSQIVNLLSSELVLLILLAFVIVTPLAWWAMNKWMQTFADRTTISWWIFAASGAGMLLAAVFTSSFQTIKAAIANPVNSLRSE